VDVLQQRKRLAHSAREALERITGEELPQWKLTQLRQAPDTVIAEIVEALTERVAELDGICNKSAVRIAKLERKVEELTSKPKKPPRARKFSPVEE
jgi:hypothetical protein